MTKKAFRVSALQALMTLFPMIYTGNVLATIPSTAAVNTDKQNSFVHDQTSQVIDQVNMIACLISGMDPAEMVNKGPYVALVNKKTCDSSSRSDASGSTSDSSGSSQASYMRAIIDSTRADNNSPMRVKAWVENEEGGQSMTIFINILATSSPSSSNPYGVFRMDYASPNSQSGSPLMQGFIDAATTGLTFVDQSNRGGGGGGGGGSSGPELTQLVLNTSGTTTGSGAASFPDESGISVTPLTFAFGYDSTHFRRQKNSANDRCFSRLLTDAGESIWRYGLYDTATGDRIDLKSGFPVSVTISDKTYQGFMGYYGLSFPSSVASQLTDNMTITQFDGQTNTNYKLKISHGRLTKFTKKSRTLASIDHIPFQFFAQNAITGMPSEATGKMLQAYWNQSNSSFIVTGSSQCSQNGCFLKDFETPITITGSSLAGQVQGGMHGFSQPLGGDLFIPATTMQDSAQNVIYREAKLLYPNDVVEVLGKTFHCISNCMTTASLANFAAHPSSSRPFASNENFGPTPSSSIVNYQMNDAGEMVASTDSAAAVWTADQSALNGTPYMGGIRSGRLVTDADLSSLQCEGSGSGTFYCDWKAEQVDNYYVWETGPSTWNQFAGLQDTQGAFVSFDAPKVVNYTVPSDSTVYGQYAGHSIALQYGGFGQLWGIPGSCVDGDNNAVSCDTQNARYVPAFSIPDTVGQNLVTDSEDSTKQYLVKWLDREVRFKKVDPANCSSLTLGDISQLPSATGLKDPSNSASDIYIGAKPDLTDAPRVIHGVVQY